MPMSLHIVYSCFCHVMAELSSCDRDPVASKASNIYSPALYREHLWTSILDQWSSTLRWYLRTFKNHWCLNPTPRNFNVTDLRWGPGIARFFFLRKYPQKIWCIARNSASGTCFEDVDVERTFFLKLVNSRIITWIFWIQISKAWAFHHHLLASY